MRHGQQVRLSVALSLIAILAIVGNGHAASIDVTSFGADPGNSSGNAAAINSAIEAASPGDVIYIPAGNYQLDGSIIPKSNIKIVGAGQGQTTLSYTASTTGPVVGFRSLSSNVTISDLTINGNNNPNAIDGVLASHDTGLALNNLGFTNFVNTTALGPLGVYFSAGVTHSAVTNCTFNNIGTGATFGGGIRFSNGSSYNQAVGNVISNTGRGGIFGDSGSGAAASTNLVIENNVVSGSGGLGLGIEVQGCPNALIQGNKVDHWISVDTSSNTAVRNNVISDNTGTFKYAGVELVNSHDVSITGNTVSGGAQIGISESNNAGQSTVRTYVAHNTIDSSSTWGVQVQGGAGGIAQQYFFKNAILNTIANGPNTLYGPQGQGFRINGNAQNLVLDTNSISNNGGSGLQTVGSNVTNLRIINNTITNNGGPSVTAAITASNVRLSANTISGNRSYSAIAGLSADAAAPNLTLTAPVTVVAGDTANFAIDFTSAGSPLANVLWDFGNGLPMAATDTSASYVYDTPGTYTMAVVAWDANGNAAQSEATINVIDSVPEPVTASLALSGVALLGMRRRRVVLR
ncbi:MAG: right-handed parallel beta-helix repeat-containing protein [Planctomycetota bacterium]|nr:right-handed parallel beta-helix repeat-containing protein [Planctomycetota bacterium]